jgi:DNA ligase (NAD+)
MIPTHNEELELLRTLGFPVNDSNLLVSNIEEVWQYSQKIKTDAQSMNYPIDGLVVKLDNNIIKESLGTVGKTPRGWCAIKFPAKEVATIIKDITWQVGRTGKITPVAELEPIELLGTIVKRATLHNFQNVKDLELSQGDYVVIRKAGDIIPEVVGKV